MAKRRPKTAPPKAQDLPASHFEAINADTGEIQNITRLNEHGQEIPDPRPVAVSLGIQHPPTLQEQVLQLFRAEEFRRAAARQNFESFDEANDFDVGDFEDDLSSEYELDEFRGELPPDYVDPLQAMNDVHYRRPPTTRPAAPPPPPPTAPPDPPPQSSGNGTT